MRFEDAIRPLYDLLRSGALGSRADEELLDRFVADREEAAFAELVRRHGPMVRRVCRDTLNDPHEADDAYQATFLVLALRAGSICRRRPLAPWLYGVARRVALKARASSLRRRARERTLDDAALVPAAGPPDSAPEVFEELDRLSDRLRSVVVLCDLEGHSYASAASQLGCPEATVHSRLFRARKRLRDRLAQRGLAPAALAGVIEALAMGRASAAPAPMCGALARLAALVAAGGSAPAGAVPVAIIGLAREAMRAMRLSKLKAIGGSAMILALAGVGVTPAWRDSAATGPDPPTPPAVVAEVGRGRAPGRPPTADDDPSDLRAAAALRRFAEYASIVNSYQVNHRARGRGEDFWHTYVISAERPNRVAIRQPEWNLATTLVSDGQTLRLTSLTTKKSLEGEAMGSLGPLLTDPNALALGPSLVPFFTPTYFSVHLLVDAPDELLMAAADSCRYVGEERLDGVNADHLRFRRGDYEWDLWFASEGAPLPLRLETGPVDDRRTDIFDDWRVNQAMPPDAFALPPDAGLAKTPVSFDRPGERLLGEAAPAFGLERLGGGAMRLDDHRGQVLILDFWATWCGPCLREIPVLARVLADYRDRGVVLLASTSEDRVTVEAFLEKRPLGVTVALDRDGRCAAAYGVSSIPHLVVIDRRGTVAYVHVGFTDRLEDELRHVLDEACAGASPSPGRSGGPGTRSPASGRPPVSLQG